jgi:hypothetical protein
MCYGMPLAYTVAQSLRISVGDANLQYFLMFLLQMRTTVICFRVAVWMAAVFNIVVQMPHNRTSFAFLGEKLLNRVQAKGKFLSQLSVAVTARFEVIGAIEVIVQTLIFRKPGMAKLVVPYFAFISLRFHYLDAVRADVTALRGLAYKAVSRLPGAFPLRLLAAVEKAIATCHTLVLRLVKEA